MKIVLSNAPINNGNRGCVALTISAISIIDDILRERHLSYELLLTDSQFQVSEISVVSIGNDRCVAFKDIHKSFFLPGLKKSVLRMFKMKQYLDEIEMLKQADYWFDLGQGDSFAEIYGKQRFNLINTSYHIAKKIGIPICILPQTIGPFENEKIVDQAIKSINQATLVMTRDRQSNEYAKQLTKRDDIIEVIDVAFFMPYNKKKFTNEKIHIGLNISALLWFGGYTKDNQFGLKCDYQSTVKEIITYFLSMKDVVIHLIPHVVGSERSVENDYAVSYDLIEEFDDSNLVLAPLFLDPISAKSYISGMDFFMGARMHSAIAAFSSGVPVVPMAYSRKFNGLFEDTLDYPYVIDMKTKNDKEIIKLVAECYRSRERLKELIEIRLKTKVNERYLLLKKNIVKFLGL